MTAGSIDEYVAALAPAGAEVVEELRRRVHAVRPDVTEVLRYDIPTFQVDGRSRVHVAAWARHVSLYPVPATYGAGKGTLKLPLSEPVPWELVDRVLAALLR